MIILVAVSVSVALQGGLFDKATKAKDQTKEATVREQLQDIILGKLDVTDNTIPKDLGQVILDGITYDVTATKPTSPADAEIIISLVDPNNSSNNFVKRLETDLKITGIEISTSKAKPKVYSSAAASLLAEENRAILRQSAITAGVPKEFFDDIDFNGNCPVYNSDMRAWSDGICIVFTDGSILYTEVREEKDYGEEIGVPFVEYFSDSSYPVVWDGNKVWPDDSWAEIFGRWALFEFYDDYAIQRIT